MKPRSTGTKSNGFTLIELLVVVAILATLATVVVVAVRGAREDGDDAACRTDYVALENALEVYAHQASDAELVAFDGLGPTGLNARTGNQQRMDLLIGMELLRNGSTLYEIRSFVDIDAVAGAACVGVFDPSA